MPRQRLTIGTFGDITTRKLASGRFAARTRYRDWDGHARLVQASGATAKAAERALKRIFDEKVSDNSKAEAAVVVMSADGAVRAIIGGRDSIVNGAFNRAVRSAPGAVGIWHETYAVPAAGIETMYVDSVVGLGAATGTVPAGRRGNRAAQRLGTTTQTDAATDAEVAPA